MNIDNVLISDVNFDELTPLPPAHPSLARMFSKQGVCQVTDNILVAQKSAWIAHLLHELAYRQNEPVENIDLKTLNTQMQQHLARNPGPLCKEWDGNSFNFSVLESSRLRDSQVFASEAFAPGAIEAFYVGPSGSMLWWALGGDKLCLRRVISSFSAFIGDISKPTDLIYSRAKWMAILDPEFWVQMAEAFPLIALRILGYHIAQARMMKLVSQKITDALDPEDALFINQIGASVLPELIVYRLQTSLTVKCLLDEAGLCEDFLEDFLVSEKQAKCKREDKYNIDIEYIGLYERKFFSPPVDLSLPIKSGKDGLIWVPTGQLLFDVLCTLWKSEGTLTNLASIR